MPQPTAPRTLLLALAVGLLAAACGPVEPTSAPTAAPLEAVDPMAPLLAFGPCEQIPDDVDIGEVPGLRLPTDAILREASNDGPLWDVRGYLPMTPPQLRIHMEARTDLTLLTSEDEVFEAEILTEADGQRQFLKAQAVCEVGSVFVATILPAPEPAGDPT